MNLPEPYDRLPFTFRDEPVGAWPNYYLSLTELVMRQPRADAYMLVQDDTLFYDNEGLKSYIETVCWPGRKPCLMSLYCGDADTGPTPGWHQCEGPMKGGLHALVFPRELVKAFLTDRNVFEHRWNADERAATSIGGVISLWAFERDIPVWLPTPSLVQHIGDTSTIWPMARATGNRRARWFAGGDNGATAER